MLQYTFSDKSIWYFTAFDDKIYWTDRFIKKCLLWGSLHLDIRYLCPVEQFQVRHALQ